MGGHHLELIDLVNRLRGSNWACPDCSDLADLLSDWFESKRPGDNRNTQAAQEGTNAALQLKCGHEISTDKDIWCATCEEFVEAATQRKEEG